MDIRVNREWFTSKSTEGSMYVDSEFECYTLEDVDRGLEIGGKKVYGSTAIPKGRYEVVITMSNRFKRELPLIKDVPQFTGVRIHPGNTPEDTDGCILVGDVNRGHKDDFIGNSRAAFNRLFAKIKAAIDSGDKVYITIV